MLASIIIIKLIINLIS